MICADCEERVTETERRIAIPCVRCQLPLHPECVMYSDAEDAYCEPCHDIEAKAWADGMLEGAEA